MAASNIPPGLAASRMARSSEVFLNVDKSGTMIEEIARNAAIVASIALQHGATLDELRHALMRNSDGSATGALGALLDLLAEPS